MSLITCYAKFPIVHLCISLKYILAWKEIEEDDDIESTDYSDDEDNNPYSALQKKNNSKLSNQQSKPMDKVEVQDQSSLNSAGKGKSLRRSSNDNHLNGNHAITVERPIDSQLPLSVTSSSSSSCTSTESKEQEKLKFFF